MAESGERIAPVAGPDRRLHCNCARTKGREELQHLSASKASRPEVLALSVLELQVEDPLAEVETYVSSRAEIHDEHPAVPSGGSIMNRL